MNKMFLSSRDVAVLREAVWHAVQRGDIPDDDRHLLHDLYGRLKGNNIIPEEAVFKDPTDELYFHLVRSEHHAQKALDLLYKPDGPKRSIWFRMAIGRAQNILMSAYVRDLRLGR